MTAAGMYTGDEVWVTAAASGQPAMVMPLIPVVELACGHPFAVLNGWQPRVGQWITCATCQGQRKITGWS